MATTLSDLSVDSKVSVKIDGQSINFLVVHQGNPNPALYDASCTGTWLMMEPIYTKQWWGHSGNYADSYAHYWLNTTLFPKLDKNIQSMVLPVKLPYADYTGVYTGADGLECRMFLPSVYELGWTSAYMPTMVEDGACLDYCQDFKDIDSRRIAKTLAGSKIWYWTRTPDEESSSSVWLVVSVNGDCASSTNTSSYGIRPLMIFDPKTLVDKNNAVQANSAPVITSPSGVSGANLGLRTGPFLLEYTATDPEGSDVYLTEKLDEKTTRTLDTPSGTAQQFQAVNDSLTFLQLSNDAHTVAITASDGLLSSQMTLSFTKAVTRATLTLVQPLPADAPIQVAAMVVAGEIPEDADLSVEVTNNALDPEPVWQDATDEVRRGYNILFENRTTSQQPAFNFRLAAARGPSGTGGHIDQVAGAFQ